MKYLYISLPVTRTTHSFSIDTVALCRCPNELVCGQPSLDTLTRKFTFKIKCNAIYQFCLSIFWLAHFNRSLTDRVKFDAIIIFAYECTAKLFANVCRIWERVLCLPQPSSIEYLSIFLFCFNYFVLAIWTSCSMNLKHTQRPSVCVCVACFEPISIFSRLNKHMISLIRIESVTHYTRTYLVFIIINLSLSISTRCSHYSMYILPIA